MHPPSGLTTIGTNQTGARAHGLNNCTRPWRSIPTGRRSGCCAPTSPCRPIPPAPRRASRRSRFAGSRGCMTAPRRPATCPTPARCASWTERPTSSTTCSSNSARRSGGRPAGAREDQPRPRRGGRRRGRPGRRAPVRQGARCPVPRPLHRRYGKAHARRPASNAASPNASRDRPS